MWNISFRHRLVDPTGPYSMRYTSVHDNLSDLRKIFDHCKISSLDIVAADYASKLFDIALTALLVVRTFKLISTSNAGDNALSRKLLELVHWVLGIILTVSHAEMAVIDESAGASSCFLSYRTD